jgi:hypothetical protein
MAKLILFFFFLTSADQELDHSAQMIAQKNPDWLRCTDQVDCVLITGFCGAPAAIHKMFKKEGAKFFSELSEDCRHFTAPHWPRDARCVNLRCVLGEFKTKSADVELRPQIEAPVAEDAASRLTSSEFKAMRLHQDSPPVDGAICTSALGMEYKKGGANYESCLTDDERLYRPAGYKPDRPIQNPLWLDVLTGGD